MRIADIREGAELAYSSYGFVAKVRVIEKGLPSPHGFEKAKNGVRIEVIDRAGARRAVPAVVKSRELDPWSARDEDKMARIRGEEALEARVLRVSDRIDMPAFARLGTNQVSMRADDFFALLERFGVDTA